MDEKREENELELIFLGVKFIYFAFCAKFLFSMR